MAHQAATAGSGARVGPARVWNPGPVSERPSGDPQDFSVSLDPDLKAFLDRMDGADPAGPADPPSRVGSPADEPTQDPASSTPDRESREPTTHAWWAVPFGGMVGALVFALGGFTPSLLPRGGVMQGIIAGLVAALGYGLVLLVMWIVRQFLPWDSPWYGNRKAWSVLGSVGAGALTASIILAKARQDDLHMLMGMQTPGWSFYPLALLTSATVFVLLLAVFRLLRRLLFWVGRGLGRFVPARTSAALGILLVGVLAFLVIDGLLVRGALGIIDAVFEEGDKGTDPGVEQPDSAAVSGGPASSVPWADLGRKGREFIGGVTSTEEIDAFSGGGAIDPIRVYVGLGSSEDADERARIAVAELQSLGAFDRAVLAVGTTTGTGWVDPDAVEPLELMYNGDTAIVATQYSYLPSWLSFLFDQDRATEAGRTLFDAVYDAWAELPEGQRPRLVVFGESLGAYGAQAAFSGLADLVNRTDGAMFVGPPSSSGLWRRYTDDRDPGSPQIVPVYRQGEHLRWAQSPEDLDDPATAWDDPRVVYLQNASDPVVWWSPELLVTEPDWLREPRGPDVLPQLRWLPVITFLQVSGDMLDSTGVPYGHGHVYQSNQADVWARIIPPPGWTDADADRLMATVQGTN